MLFVHNVYCQDERTYGIRLGFDVSRIPHYFTDPKMKGLEFAIDFEALPDIYPVIEFGYSSLDIEKNNFQYYSDNKYFRIGMDYNILDPDVADQYGMAFIGIRYGNSSLNYRAENITITDGYWGNYLTSLSERKNNAHWIELTAGLKAEIFHNLFLGWSLRARFMLSKTKDEIMDPYRIPGYGKGSSKSALGFNYSVYYKIPVFKKKK